MELKKNCYRSFILKHSNPIAHWARVGQIASESNMLKVFFHTDVLSRIGNSGIHFDLNYSVINEKKQKE
jgi:hypothetical protein